MPYKYNIKFRILQMRENETLLRKWSGAYARLCTLDHWKQASVCLKSKQGSIMWFQHKIHSWLSEQASGFDGFWK